MFPLFLLGLSILASFIFAGFETGFISWNYYKVEALANEGKVSARLGRTLQNNRAKVLTTVLVGNNIALVVMENSFSSVLQGLGIIFPAIVQSLVLTLFVVLFCELLPKSLYRIYSFRLTYQTVPFLSFFYYLIYPISLFFELISKLVSRNKRSEISSVGAIAVEGVAQDELPPLLPTFLDTSCSSDSFGHFCTTHLPWHKGVAERSISPSTTIAQIVAMNIPFEKSTFTFSDTPSQVYNSQDVLEHLFR